VSAGNLTYSLRYTGIDALRTEAGASVELWCHRHI
jgi:hypothetical protein